MIPDGFYIVHGNFQILIEIQKVVKPLKKNKKGDHFGSKLFLRVGEEQELLGVKKFRGFEN